ncbi:MAG TPA: hypothetical protein DCQ31_10830 [Bacteroidales bacterium]|nr:hypothetical protein [Bacteroidales bacterium]
MVTQDSNLDKLFRNKLQGFAPTPSAAVWGGIQAEIAPAAGAAIWFIGFRKTVAVAAAIILLFSSGWYLSNLYNGLQISQLTAQHHAELTELQQQNSAYKNQLLAITETKNSNESNFINSITQAPIAQVYTQNEVTENSAVFDLKKESATEIYDPADELAVLQFINSRKRKSQETEQLNPITNFDVLQLTGNNVVDNAVTPHVSWRKRKYSVGTSAGPSMAFSVGMPEVVTGDLFQPAIEASEYQSVERALTTFTSGADISFKVSKRLSFRTGIYMNKRTQLVEGIALREEANGQIKSFSSSSADVAINFDQINYAKAAVFNPENEVNPVVLSIYSKDFDLRQEFNYVEVPLMTKYHLFSLGVDVNLLSGFTAGILTGNHASVSKGENVFWKGETGNLNKVLYSAGAGLGFTYNLGNYMSINLEPLVKYSFTPVNTNKVTYNYPITFGIFSGISYSF